MWIVLLITVESLAGRAVPIEADKLSPVSREAHTNGQPCYLPIQKLEKIRPKRSSLENSPVISPKAC